MTDRDEIALLLADLPRDPASPRDVALAAAQYGWWPDPPWFPASQPVKRP